MAGKISVSRLCCSCRWHVLNVCNERESRLSLCLLRSPLKITRNTVRYEKTKKDS